MKLLKYFKQLLCLHARSSLVGRSTKRYWFSQVDSYHHKCEDCGYEWTNNYDYPI